jgi:hypothetical protein
MFSSLFTITVETFFRVAKKHPLRYIQVRRKQTDSSTSFLLFPKCYISLLQENVLLLLHTKTPSPEKSTQFTQSYPKHLIKTAHNKKSLPRKTNTAAFLATQLLKRSSMIRGELIERIIKQKISSLAAIKSIGGFPGKNAKRSGGYIAPIINWLILE